MEDNLTQSESLDQLEKAVFNLHAANGTVLAKNTKGNRGKYANLPQILNSIAKACHPHGLVLRQKSCIIDGKYAVYTKLSHAPSGQWDSSISLLSLPVNPQNPDQAWGGSHTYHRRYDAMSILGLFASDDPADHDGWNNEENEAGEGDVGAQKTPEHETQYCHTITREQEATLRKRLDGDIELAKSILKRYGITLLKDIPVDGYDEALDFVISKKRELENVIK